MDAGTRRAIEKVTLKTLRDAGIARPPVYVEPLLDHLRLYREFYDLQNPNFLDRAKYRLLVESRKATGILRKLKLAAFLFYDDNRIIIDSNLPVKKRVFPAFHEICHRIYPWHKASFYGDTAQTLDPDWQEILEAEANYGASTLMFCGPMFTSEALDLPREWASIENLQKRYDKSLQSTLRRFVLHGHNHPMAMMVSSPWWREKPADQPERWRHFNPSDRFTENFSTVTPQQLLCLVDSNSCRRVGGMVADFICGIPDVNAQIHEFHVETFFNRHDLLSLFVQVKPMSKSRIVVPKIIETV